MTLDAHEGTNAVSLLPVVTNRFNTEELRTLWFDLQIDYDDLRGEGKEAPRLVSSLRISSGAAN